MKNSKIFNEAGKTVYGLVAGLMLAASIASCSSDNSENIEPSDVAISFTATAPYAPQSRAVVTTQTLSSFRVYGFVDKELYMNNVEVNKVGNKWQYSPLQYWPIGKSINFYSYSPAIVNAGACRQCEFRQSGYSGLHQQRHHRSSLWREHGHVV